MCVDIGARIFISMRGMSGQLGYTTPQMVPLYNHILFITDLGPHARIQNPRTTPSGRKLGKGERMREKMQGGKSPSIVATTSFATPKDITHFAWTKHLDM